MIFSHKLNLIKFFMNLFKQNKEMTYFTSWDANVFLCLVTWGISGDVVKDSGLWRLTKKTHEEFVRLDTLHYYCNLARHILYKSKTLFFPSLATQQLKAKWKWRCPERRRENVASWSRSLWVSSYALKNAASHPGEGKCRDGYWDSGEAWSYSIKEEYYSEEELDELTMEYDNENTWERHRTLYVSQWYKDIHEGRYFLFFKENDYFSTYLYDKYRDEEHAIRSICDLAARGQIQQDLLTIDGRGLGQEPGNHVEHIDDLFH